LGVDVKIEVLISMNEGDMIKSENDAYYQK